MTPASPALPLSHARRFAWPLPDFWASGSLSGDDLRAYWHFRRGFMDLKPRVDPEEDHARFAAWVRASDFVWARRGGDGRLLAAMTWALELRAHEGRECVIVRPEYGFALPEARKSVGIGVAGVAAMGLAARRWPGRPMYLFGSAYVSSYVAITSVFVRAWVRDAAGMSPWERSLWHAIAAETRGYDPVTRLVDMDTIPRHPRTDPPRDPRMIGRWQEYLAHNPRWTEGYACLVCVRLAAEDLVTGVRILGRRALGGG